MLFTLFYDWNFHYLLPIFLTIYRKIVKRIMKILFEHFFLHNTKLMDNTTILTVSRCDGNDDWARSLFRIAWIMIDHLNLTRVFLPLVLDQGNMRNLILGEKHKHLHTEVIEEWCVACWGWHNNLKTMIWSNCKVNYLWCLYPNHCWKLKIINSNMN